MYHGDTTLGTTRDFKFTTVNASGIPTTLAGVPVVSAYVGNGTTEITAGITLSVDFDGRTGLHNVRVVASGANGFAADTDVQLVITTGTVDGNSVVGYVIASFSIQARSAATPAQVNAEVLDVLTVDTFAEPAALPAATSTIKDKLNWLFALGRNKITLTAPGVQTLRNDADSGTIATSTAVDSAGTTTRPEWV